ncbi:MAG: beta-lactamase family protein [Chloroflexota bacterium]|nr:beta-lactamase family protein [Chloroflexota bacterium]
MQTQVTDTAFTLAHEKHPVCFDRERLRHAAEIADTAVASGSHPCALIAVADSTRTVWTHVVSGEDGARLDGIFLLASITKPIVATAVMQLVEQGRLLLDAPVAQYIPEFAGAGKERVTTWHLLTHTSGMEEVRWWKELRETRGGHEAALGAACNSHLHFEPGARCEYCSLSFTVLGELITRLSGQPYPEYLREHIFAPLGMSDTAFRPVDAARALPVHDHGGPEDLEWFTSLAIPGGGLWSSAADLLAFGQAYLRGSVYDGYRLLGPAALETMTRSHTSGMVEIVDGRPQPFEYGLGWGKLSPNNGIIGSARSYGHGGATGTYFWVDPVYDLVYVFLTNRWGLEHNTPRRALNAVYGALSKA